MEKCKEFVLLFMYKSAALFEKSVSQAERAWSPTAVGGAKSRVSGNFLAGEIDRVFSKIKPLTKILI